MPLEVGPLLELFTTMTAGESHSIVQSVHVDLQVASLAELIGTDIAGEFSYFLLLAFVSVGVCLVLTKLLRALQTLDVADKNLIKIFLFAFNFWHLSFYLIFLQTGPTSLLSCLIIEYSVLSLHMEVQPLLKCECFVASLALESLLIDSLFSLVHLSGVSPDGEPGPGLEGTQFTVVLLLLVDSLRVGDEVADLRGFVVAQFAGIFYPEMKGLHVSREMSFLFESLATSVTSVLVIRPALHLLRLPAHLLVFGRVVGRGQVRLEAPVELELHVTMITAELHCGYVSGWSLIDLKH